MKTKRSTMVAMTAAFAAAMAMGEAAQALDCKDIGGVPSGDDCTLSQEYECTGNTQIDIVGSLAIDGTGAITCGSNHLLLNVGGNLVVADGGSITANGSDGGAAAMAIRAFPVTPAIPVTPVTAVCVPTVNPVRQALPARWVTPAATQPLRATLSSTSKAP